MSDNMDYFKGSALLNFYSEYQMSHKSGFAVFDNEGKLIKTNDIFLSIAKIKKTDLNNIKVMDYFNLDKKDIDNFLKGNIISAQVKLSKNNLIEIHMGLMSHSGKNQMGFIIATDKSKEKNYLDDLSNNLVQLRALIDDFHIGFIILNEKHEVIEANKTFADNLGYTIDECLKLTGWDYIKDFSKYQKKYKFKLNSTYDFKVGNYHIKKNGEFIPVKATCSMGRVNGKDLSICFYENIQEQVESKYRMEQSEKLLSNFISNSSDVVLMLDKKMNIRYLSSNIHKVFDCKTGENEETIIEKYLPLKDSKFEKFIQKEFESDNSIEYEYSVVDTKTKYYSIKTSTISINEKLIVCYIRDITKDKEYIEELMILSYTDQLTQLYNRKFMEEQLLNLREKDNLPISVISADLDGLKEVNDSLGHQAGDELLKIFSNILLNSHEKREEIFRIGGDEFVIIATKTDEDKANSLISKINKTITKHNSSPSSLLKVSVSLGASTTSHLSTSLTAILANADKEMYDQKRKRKLNKSPN